MYKFDDIGSTYLSLPPNLQTLEYQCFCYALDCQIHKLKKMADSLTIWSDLDHVNPRYYDYLAMCIRAPYYKSEYADEQKLDLIKTAIMSYRYAGTRKAVNQIINIIFDKAYFIPWNEYNGKPYHFRVQVFDKLEEDTTFAFISIIKKVKAARSVMDALQKNVSYEGSMYVAGCLKAGMRAVIRENI